MNRNLIIGGFFLLLISIIITPKTFSEYTIHRLGQLVTVKTIQLPDCQNSYKNNFLTIRFQDSNYTLRTKCKFTKNLHQGQEIQMLHKEGANAFLFPEENALLKLISNMFIGLLGVIIMIIGLRNYKKQYRALV